MKHHQTLLLFPLSLMLASCIYVESHDRERDPVLAGTTSEFVKCSQQDTLDKIINESAGFPEDRMVIRHSHPEIDCSEID